MSDFFTQGCSALQKRAGLSAYQLEFRSVQSYFLLDPNLQSEYISKLISGYPSGFGISQEEIMSNSVLQSYLAIAGVFTSGYFYALDAETKRLSLYTSSASAISNLIHKGLVSDETNNVVGLRDFLYRVYSFNVSGAEADETAKGYLKKGVLPAYSVTPKEGKYILRKTLLSYTTPIFPLEYFAGIREAMRNTLTQGVFYIKRTITGESGTSHSADMVTLSAKVLQAEYPAVKAKDLIQKSLIQSLDANTVYFPVVNAGELSSGMLKVRLSDVDSIELIPYTPKANQVDTQKAPETFAVRYFVSQWVLRETDPVSVLVQLGVDTNATREASTLHQKRLAAISEISKYNNRALYDSLPLNIRDEYNQFISKEFPLREVIPQPYDPDQIKDLLSSSVLYVKATTVKGETRSYYVTNNNQLLSSIYGESAVYGRTAYSSDERYAVLQAAGFTPNTGVLSHDEIVWKLCEFGLLDLVSKYYPEFETSEITAVRTVCGMIENSIVNEKQEKAGKTPRTRIPNPDLISAQSVLSPYGSKRSFVSFKASLVQSITKIR